MATTGRHFALYFSWNRPRETGASLGTLENRFPALFELRRAVWPQFEWARDEHSYPQGITGFLDHVILSDFEKFRQTIDEATGHPVELIERRDDGPRSRRLDKQLLQDIDTLIVVSLDHLVTDQNATLTEFKAVERFLEREDTLLVLCPHHDIGAGSTQESRARELAHHGDRLVPSQQRLGGFARSLLTRLGLPIENRFGLRPARAADGSPAPLDIAHDLDELGILDGVTTFNLHPHLPHLVVDRSGHDLRILARQRIDPAAPPHPFTDQGEDRFNAMVFAPPSGKRAGHVLVCDATLWSSAFGGDASLNTLWRNLARGKR